jgi:hypothetical protein
MIQFPHTCEVYGLKPIGCEVQYECNKWEGHTLGFSFNAYSNRYDTNWGQGR